ESVEVCRNRRVQRHTTAAGQNALTGVFVWHGRHSRDSKALDQTLIRSKKERFVVVDWSTDRCAELIPLERRNGFVEWIKEIFGVERGIAKEFKGGTVHSIFARACNRVNDASRGPAEFRRVRIRQDLEFKHRIYAQQHTADRARRLVLHVVNVPAIPK